MQYATTLHTVHTPDQLKTVRKGNFIGDFAFVFVKQGILFTSEMREKRGIRLGAFYTRF